MHHQPTHGSCQLQPSCTARPRPGQSRQIDRRGQDHISATKYISFRILFDLIDSIFQSVTTSLLIARPICEEWYKFCLYYMGRFICPILTSVVRNITQHQLICNNIYPFLINCTVPMKGRYCFTWMAKISARATNDFCPPESWFISLISACLPVKETEQDTPVACSSLWAWSSSW